MLPSPPELVADVVQDDVVLTKSQVDSAQGHLGQQFDLPHEFRELEENEVVAQEASAFVLFDGRPDAVDHFEHSDDLVCDFALYVRWLLPRYGEQNMIVIIHVFSELYLRRGFL